MNARVVLFFIMMLISCSPRASISSLQDDEPLNILIVNSWHLGMPWQNSFEKGLKSTLSQFSTKPNIYIEYLDAGRFSDEAYQQNLSRHIINKYRKTRLDIVISESRPAGALLFRNQDSFPDARRIYVQPGFDELDIIHLKNKKDKIIPVDSDFEGAIREVLKVANPEHIYVVSDASTPARMGRLKGFRNAIDRFSGDFSVHELVDLPMMKLIDATANLPDNSVIFYLLVFKDGDGKRYIPFDALKLIAEKANAPIFSHWDTLMGTGMLGGYLLSGERVGRITGQVIIDPEFSVNNQKSKIAPHGIYYDWTQVVRWRLQKNMAPDAMLINYSPGLFERYFWYFTVLGGLIGFLIIITLILFIINQKKQRALLEISVEQKLLTVQTKELQLVNEQLETLSLSDALTQLSNRRHFDELLKVETIRLSRSQTQMSLLMIDVDNFKNYNDLYGHLCGDQCLQQVASAISLVFNRTTDFPARYGGEEFAVILANTDASGAVVLAETLRDEIFNLDHPNVNSATGSRVTVSIGAVTVDGSSIRTPEQIIRLADEQLYLAKDRGRNRVESKDFSEPDGG